MSQSDPRIKRLLDVYDPGTAISLSVKRMAAGAFPSEAWVELDMDGKRLVDFGTRANWAAVLTFEQNAE